ncbi:ABC transporter permease subunit [Paeniglutamicibacter sp. NPDC012692]|uniref:ABC transporter permease subunit n=1 Tax=Paeniglutamicibacter sp. NPDC012692 TaxID=3364388 RepID=UPI00367B2D31
MVEIDEQVNVAKPRRQAPPPRKRSHGPDSLGGTLAKIILLGITDAVAAFVLFQLALSGEWLIFGISLLTTLAINWIYLRRGGLPAKYLAPGVIFLMVFQVFVMIFSTYIAFTNYGDGHNSTKADAIASIQLSASERVPDSPQFPTSVLEKDGSYFLLVTTPEGGAKLGGTDQPLATVTPSTSSPTGAATGVEGYTTLDFATLLQHQAEITALSVPISANPEDGSLKTADGSTSYVYTPKLKYDAAADTFTDTQTGVVYSDNGRGSFVAPDGTSLNTGWKVNVGLENFQRAFTDPNLQGPLVQVVLWTFAFAILSVATTFALGLFLAITFNKADLKGKKLYRILMILPYAFPAFLSGLVWSGLLNPEFGFINNAILGGADIPWLTDPVLAKVSVLVVNLWLGYPYMFLVCTGALQSLPEEVDEAARMDGASPWRIFTAIKLPLLLVSLAPLLISSFAFNFNNFNVIYMLTGGGPRFADTTFDIGSTDILITMVYKIAFGTGTGRDYGLASALAILIFVIVAAVSALSFKKTKALEEIN